MSELDAAQNYLNKKFPGYTLIPEDEFAKGTFIQKKKVDAVIKYFSNEIKGKKLSKCGSEERNHIARISASRLIISILELRTDEELSATMEKASVRLTDEEKSFEKAIIACRDYMTYSKASPEVMFAELKAELMEE
jgi:hypothetical protein